MDDALVDAVLTAVEQVPRGAVVSYGDLAELVGIGPRQVGAVMSRHGAQVTWWRVVNARGELPATLLEDARAHWHDEGITLTPDGARCRIDVHRADLRALAGDWQAAMTTPSPSESPQEGP